MTFMELAESGLIYALVIGGICFVLLFAFVFLRKSWVRAYEIGYTKEQLMNVVKSTVTATIVPSLAIVVGFFGLAAMLGIPWPWWRLSVIGSVGYEIMAADMALSSAGVDLVTATATDFNLIMYVMTICILGGAVGSLFMAKPIQTGTMKMKEKDQRWGTLSGSIFMLVIMVVFLVPMLMQGLVPILTIITSMAVSVVVTLIANKLNMKWLNNFTLAFALIIAMASSVLWTNLFG